jgi:glycosyltransferase involved in cell wall biosynthesis
MNEQPLNESPRVSVLMSVFNGERYLRESIDSILSQSFSDFEFLIINDGSSDASRSIILAYDDPRIRLIENEENIGLTQSLNRGLALARGEFIARQDADDISLPARLAKQVAFLDANPHVLLVGSWYQEVDANGTLQQRARVPTDEVELRWALLFFCPFIHSAVMMRKDPVLNEIGYYSDEYEYAQDHELWLRIARRKSLTNLKAYLVKYRRSPDSMTAKYGAFSKEGMKVSVDAIGDLLGWSAEDCSRNEALFKEMFQVLYGRQISLGLAGVMQTTNLIWQLHQAFCQSYMLNSRQVKKHQGQLRVWLGRRYIFLADQLLHRGNPGDAWIAFYEGCRLSFRNLVRMRTILFLSKVLRRKR